MEYTEIKFEDLRHLSYNQEMNDHRVINIDGKTLYVATVYDGSVRSVGPVRNEDLPLKPNDNVRYYLSNMDSLKLLIQLG